MLRRLLRSRSTCQRCFSSGPTLEDLSQAQVKRIGERTQSQWLEHITLKTKSFPAASIPPEGKEAITPDILRRKRLIYRSKQRGWLEVDLLMGTWAHQNVMTLTVPEMDEYEAILNCETIDIYNYISGSQPPPQHLDTPMLKRLQDFALTSPVGRANPEAYADAKRSQKLT
ncbi:unnamed protein product [Chrysoparadoxa australica]